jgi:hypothetical protein
VELKLKYSKLSSTQKIVDSKSAFKSSQATEFYILMEQCQVFLPHTRKRFGEYVPSRELSIPVLYNKAPGGAIFLFGLPKYLPRWAILSGMFLFSTE